MTSLWLRFQLLCARIPPVRGSGAITLGVAAAAASLLLFPPAKPAEKKEAATAEQQQP